MLHLGLWLRRDRPEVLFPRISLAILLLEVVVLVVDGLTWGWLNLLIGLLFPISVMGIDAVVRRVNFPPFYPNWWMPRYKSRPVVIIKDSVVLQVSILIFLLCSTVGVGYLVTNLTKLQVRQAKIYL
ncbi:MAG: hypothetical protein V7L20_07950 [Nostoc sp.]|uniref:hypothetical protein n=1 Tax=Nostoc sp. TaxID=1180 RepID=UPI002FF704F7